MIKCNENNMLDRRFAVVPMMDWMESFTKSNGGRVQILCTSVLRFFTIRSLDVALIRFLHCAFAR
jgi:hypothetical protein